jgi:ribosomal protein S18 acetylase RimI-like enzyme
MSIARDFAATAGETRVDDSLTVRKALPSDLCGLHPVIERAYRGESARQGWTHEADLLSGERIDFATLKALLDDPVQRLLVACRGEAIAGCVSLTPHGDGRVYLGLLCVDPAAQAAGIGKAIIAAAEHVARNEMSASHIEMTVISSRKELIDYYERRGFRRTDETRPFPILLDPPLEMIVLEKALA